jgi:hypothetical protein
MRRGADRQVAGGATERLGLQRCPPRRGRAGRLWELDGRRAGPVDRGVSSAEQLLADAARVVRDFVSRCGT